MRQSGGAASLCPSLEVVDKPNREIDLLIETFERLSEGALVSAPYRFRPLNGAAPIRSVLPQIRHRGREGRKGAHQD